MTVPVTAPVRRSSGRHRRPSPPAGARLSRSTWRRVLRSLTAGLFVVATVSGVGVGLSGAMTSPVAPPTAAAVVAASQDLPAAVTPHGHHR